MDRTLVRNFFIFTALTLICFGALAFILSRSESQIKLYGDWVAHSNRVLVTAQALSSLSEGMLSSQRGYLLTGNKSFMDEYEELKRDMSQRLAELNEITRDNPSQQSRLDEIRGYFSGMTFKLEERARTMRPLRDPKAMLEGAQSIDGLRRNILRVHKDMITEEYSILEERVRSLEAKKNQYYSTMMIGGTFCIAIMLLLNAFLLHAQTRRSNAEKFLKESEDRFALAANGANDGIFDWNIDTGAVFFSRPYFSMLGIDQPAHVGHVDDVKDLLHPEDAERVWAYVDQYLRGELSEFSIVFRMRHISGRWIWISSRAKALYDESGRPHRMVGAHTDITYLKEKQRQLEEAKEIAENASQAKTEFLAHMSHEIRTPLTAINGIAEILERQKDKMSEKQNQLVNTLVSSTATLKDLINDILDFSKIESGEITLENKPFKPVDVFHQVISITSVQAREKGLQFKVDSDHIQNVTYNGDSARLRQILINLIGNAVKFTDKGHIHVKAARESGENGIETLSISVEDTGIGIKPEAMDLVFERFKQGDSSVSRKYGGTGLGLPISRNLARLMGGDITVKSEENKGSSFTLRIPLPVVDEKSPEPEEQAKAEVKKPLPQRKKKSSADDKRVLVVEDYEGNIVVVSYFLEDLKLPFDVARSGRQALSLWEQRPYDLILMDIQMPEMDGFTATRKIREMEAKGDFPRTPIIGMTAHALVGDRDKCIEAGMDAYLPKPIVEADLRDAILNHLKSKKSKAA